MTNLFRYVSNLRPFAKTFIHLYIQVEIAAPSQDLLTRRLWPEDQTAYCEVCTNVSHDGLRHVNSPLSKLSSRHSREVEFTGLRKSDVGKDISRGSRKLRQFAYTS